MPATSKTKRSTRRLSEVARHVVIPSGIASTGWPKVAAQCREWGDSFDAWQDGLGRVVLGKRENGKYAATVGGVTLSIPRQVAKTFFVGRVVFALCALFPGTKVLWTAHHTRTATNTFRNLSAFARRRKVAPHIDINGAGKMALRSTNGEQEIRFANGSIIMFGARDQGFGLGFDAVDIEVFDEAQRLHQRALDDMVAATNQSRHPHGALLFYMGTPPRPTDDIDKVFADRRNEALAIKGADAPAFGAASVGGDAIFVECSADASTGTKGGPSLDDHTQWARANPSFPDRTPVESMLRLRKNLRSDASWRREALGIWDDGVGARSEVSVSAWSKLLSQMPPREGGRVAYGVKFSPSGKRFALAACRAGDDELAHVEVITEWPMAHGTSELEAWLVERWRKAAAIVIDGKSGAGPLKIALRDAGVPDKRIATLTTDQAVTAHALMLSAITDSSVTHFGQPRLTTAVASAAKRKIGNAGGFGWTPIGDGDVLPLDAVTLAHYGARTAKKKSRTGDGWRAVTA